MAIADAGKQQKRPISSPQLSSQEVEFTFTAPNAKKVAIAGQFNNWNPNTMPMKKEKNGMWKIKLKLPAGKCEYKFFVDGTWVNDTTSRESVPNSFGTSNSVINVH